MFRPQFRYTHKLVDSLLRVERARAVIDVLPLAHSTMNDLRETARRAMTQAARNLDRESAGNYTNALSQWASKSDDCPDAELLQALNQALVGRSSSGYRTSDSLIYNQSRTELVYVPPESGQVPALLADLLDWLSGAWATLPAVVLAGICQQELLLIRPFERGNGPLARLAADVVLWRKGCSLCGYALAETELARDPVAYEYATQATHAGAYSNPSDFTSWLEFYANVLAVAAGDMAVQVQARFEAAHRPKIEGVVAEPMLLRDRQRMAIEYLRAHGAIRSGEYQKLAHIVPDTARRDFDELMDKGLIEVRGVGRGTHYVLTSLGMLEAERKKE